MGSAVEHEYDLAAEEVSGAGIHVVDIRGTRPYAAVTPVLADPSGVRARRLARVGRAVAFVCLLWLVGLGLAGIGILPAGNLPLGRVITGGARGVPRISPRPAPSRFDPAGARATSADAVSIAAERAVRFRSRVRPTAAGVRQATSRRKSESSAVSGAPAQSTTRRSARGLPGSASGARGQGTPTDAAVGSNGATSASSQSVAAGASNPGIHATGRGISTAPGTTIKTATPGHTTTHARGNSGTARGHLEPMAATVTTAPGKSGSSPGRTMTSSGGHGHGA